MKTNRDFTSKRYTKRGGAFAASMALSVVILLCAGSQPIWANSGLELSEAACDSLIPDHGKSAASTAKIKMGCCDRVFREAATEAKKEFDLGTTRLVAAGRGRLLCVDELKPASMDSAKLSPQLLRRNIITGSNSKLNQISALAFAVVDGRVQLFVANSTGSQDQIFAFNPLFSGNVFPDREWHAKGISQVIALSADSKVGVLTLLGADGAIRRASLKYNDLGLKSDDKSRIDSTLVPLPSLVDPISIAVSELLGKIFVLTADGSVHVFARDGKAAAESSYLAQGIDHPLRIEAVEISKKVKIRVLGADGSAFEAEYSLAP